MSQTVTAIFDSQSLRPELPIDLEINQRYIVIIHDDEPKDSSEAAIHKSLDDASNILKSSTATAEAI